MNKNWNRDKQTHNISNLLIIVISLFRIVLMIRFIQINVLCLRNNNIPTRLYYRVQSRLSFNSIDCILIYFEQNFPLFLSHFSYIFFCIMFVLKLIVALKCVHIALSNQQNTILMKNSVF